MSEFIAISLKVFAYKHIQVDGTVTEDQKAGGTSKTVTKKTLQKLFIQQRSCKMYTV